MVRDGIARFMLVIGITLIILMGIALDLRTTQPIDRYALETLRFNPAQGACAPCGAPCK